MNAITHSGACAPEAPAATLHDYIAVPPLAPEMSKQPTTRTHTNDCTPNMGLGFSLAQSYNSYITEPLKGLKVYANLRSEKTSGKYESLLFAEAAKFDMEGAL